MKGRKTKEKGNAKEKEEEEKEKEVDVRKSGLELISTKGVEQGVERRKKSGRLKCRREVEVDENTMLSSTLGKKHRVDVASLEPNEMVNWVPVEEKHGRASDGSMEGLSSRDDAGTPMRESGERDETDLIKSSEKVVRSELVRKQNETKPVYRKRKYKVLRLPYTGARRRKSKNKKSAKKGGTKLKSECISSIENSLSEPPQYSPNFEGDRTRESAKISLQKENGLKRNLGINRTNEDGRKGKKIKNESETEEKPQGISSRKLSELKYLDSKTSSTPSPITSISGLKTSRYGRVLLPPLQYWKNERVEEDMFGTVLNVVNAENQSLLDGNLSLLSPDYSINEDINPRKRSFYSTLPQSNRKSEKKILDSIFLVNPKEEDDVINSNGILYKDRLTHVKGNLDEDKSTECAIEKINVVDNECGNAVEGDTEIDEKKNGMNRSLKDTKKIGIELNSECEDGNDMNEREKISDNNDVLLLPVDENKNNCPNKETIKSFGTSKTGMKKEEQEKRYGKRRKRIDEVSGDCNDDKGYSTRSTCNFLIHPTCNTNRQEGDYGHDMNGNLINNSENGDTRKQNTGDATTRNYDDQNKEVSLTSENNTDFKKDVNLDEYCDAMNMHAVGKTKKKRDPDSTPARTKNKKVSTTLSQVTGTMDLLCNRTSKGSWTKEQEMMLFRAHKSLNPVEPNFWYKVSKLVPGKTSMECFDKFYENHPTPVKKISKKSRMDSKCFDNNPLCIPSHSPLKSNRLSIRCSNIIQKQQEEELLSYFDNSKTNSYLVNQSRQDEYSNDDGFNDYFSVFERKGSTGGSTVLKTHNHNIPVAIRNDDKYKSCDDADQNFFLERYVRHYLRVNEKRKIKGKNWKENQSTENVCDVVKPNHALVPSHSSLSQNLSSIYHKFKQMNKENFGKSEMVNHLRMEDIEKFINERETDEKFLGVDEDMEEDISVEDGDEDEESVDILGEEELSVHKLTNIGYEIEEKSLYDANNVMDKSDESEESDETEKYSPINSENEDDDDNGDDDSDDES